MLNTILYVLIPGEIVFESFKLITTLNYLAFGSFVKSNVSIPDYTLKLKYIDLGSTENLAVTVSPTSGSVTGPNSNWVLPIKS